MADEGFKLPGSSYAELAKIIRAYGLAPDQASPKDVADRAGIDPTQVSRSNAFLVAVGIAEGTRKKSLTPRGRSLAIALDHEMPEQVAEAWRVIASENDFLRKIVSAVRIRGGMELSSLRSHVAYTAGAAKTATSMAGAGSVVDMLMVAGFLREENGKLVAIRDAEVPSGPEAAVSESQVKPEVAAPVEMLAMPVCVSSPGVAATLEIQVRIDCSPADIETLGPRLRKMLDALAVSGSESDSTDEE